MAWERNLWQQCFPINHLDSVSPFHKMKNLLKVKVSNIVFRTSMCQTNWNQKRMWPWYLVAHTLLTWSAHVSTSQLKVAVFPFPFKSCKLKMRPMETRQFRKKFPYSKKVFQTIWKRNVSQNCNGYFLACTGHLTSVKEGAVWQKTRPMKLREDKRTTGTAQDSTSVGRCFPLNLYLGIFYCQQ